MPPRLIVPWQMENHPYITCMKSFDKRSLEEMRSLCSEPRPEDGLPPHLLKRKLQKQEHTSNRVHAHQYCKAVHRALDAGLAGVCGDERLKSLSVQSVEPLPFGSKLLVIIAVPARDAATMKSLEQTLQNAAGLLRSVIATEVQRRRTPHLTFRVVPET